MTTYACLISPNFKTDPDLCEQLVTKSKSTLIWMREKGIRFNPIFGRQAFKIDGKFKFWGGLTIETWGGGPGLLQAWNKIAEKHKIEIRYSARVNKLLYNDNGVFGVQVNQSGITKELETAFPPQAQ